MRIGELLLNAGVITEQQLDEALRAQVMWGGRLGTNLVELGALNLDEMARALGTQHGLPAALRDHFSRADRELQNKLPRELAEQFLCVPLMRAGKRIVIATCSPLSDKAVALVAGQLDINRQMIVQAVAAEMRIRFQLERVYGVRREQRFMRSRGVTEQSTLFSLPELTRAKPPSNAPRTQPITIDPPVVLDTPPRTEASAPYDASIERRTYLRTLADMLAKHDESSAMARVTRLAAGSQQLPKIAPVAETLNEALADITLAHERDELAWRTVGTVARFIPESHSALLLVVRGAAAVSWTSYCRDGTELPPLAVPLDHPGLCAAVMRRKVLARGQSGDLAPIDYLLLASLGRQFGDLVVAPVKLADHVIALVVLATEHRAAIARLDDIVAATGDGFTRLMQNAAS